MMALSRTPTENLALKLLARGGIAAIWQLHIAAAQAHRKGCPRARRDGFGDCRSRRRGMVAGRGSARAGLEARRSGRATMSAHPVLPHRAGQIIGSFVSFTILKPVGAFCKSAMPATEGVSVECKI